jgi:hypothetical protein
MGEAVFLILQTHDNAARRCLGLARRVKKSSFFLKMIIANCNLEDGRQKPILMMVVGQHEIARFFHEISRLGTHLSHLRQLEPQACTLPAQVFR